MKTLSLRTTALGGAATLAASALIVGGLAGSASADSTDPITGGQTVLAVPTSTVFASAAAGIVAIPLKPATGSYDAANKAADLTFPVSGGDGSVAAGYGSVKHSGGLVIVNYKNRHSVTLTNVTFSIEDDTVSVTPKGSTTSIVLLDVNGSHTFSRDPDTGQQEFTGDDVQIDKAGAAYLDKALITTAFKAGQHVGTFDTQFVNTQY